MKNMKNMIVIMNKGMYVQFVHVCWNVETIGKSISVTPIAELVLSKFVKGFIQDTSLIFSF